MYELAVGGLVIGEVLLLRWVGARKCELMLGLHHAIVELLSLLMRLRLEQLSLLLLMLPLLLFSLFLLFLLK